MPETLDSLKNPPHTVLSNPHRTSKLFSCSPVKDAVNTVQVRADRGRQNCSGTLSDIIQSNERLSGKTG